MLQHIAQQHSQRVLSVDMPALGCFCFGKLITTGKPVTCECCAAEQQSKFCLVVGDLAFMSPGFLSIGRHKLALIRTILGYKVDLVVSDVDTGQC